MEAQSYITFFFKVQVIYLDFISLKSEILLFAYSWINSLSPQESALSKLVI